MSAMSSRTGSTSMSSSSGRGGGRYILPDPAHPSEHSDQRLAKSYRRSRSGCFTCRLRRKKCDEERPACRSCSKLGLRCDYKTPQWWATTEQRRRQMDRIKERIRQTKVMEKEGSLREYMDRIKAMTQLSPIRTDFDTNPPVLPEQHINPYAADSLPTPVSAASTTTPVTSFSFDFKIDSESIWPTTAPSNPQPTPAAPLPTTTFANFIGPLQAPIPTPELNSEEWYQNPPATTPITTNFFHAPPFSPIHTTGYGYATQSRTLSSTLQSMVPINEADRPLLDHFVDNVIPLVFPVAEARWTGPARVQEILNSLKSNRSYMHCCLSAAAIHLKTSMGMVDEMDHDIVKHRYEAICQLCRSLNRNRNQMEVMDATLAMIFYHSSVGTSDDYLPDIPWNAHFRAVSNLVKKMNCAPSPLNVSLIAWIDILGATMLGETPQFAHTYRTKHLRGVSSGLQSLMGCDDRIMYLISEIACLESLKNEGQLDDMAVCHHVNALTSQIDWTEPLDQTLETPLTPDGSVNEDMLNKIVTMLFRISARIYLCSLLPGFDPCDPAIISLVTSVADTLQYIPLGARGYDRALVWPLFIAGANSVPASRFRKVMAERVTALGYLGDFGSFGRMYRVLKEIWRVADSSPSSPLPSGYSGDEHFFPPHLDPTVHMFEQQQHAPSQPHWREVMQSNNWSYLLM